MFNITCYRQTLFLKMGNPSLFFVSFVFSNKTLQFLQQTNVKKCPSSLQYWDSNSGPLVLEATALPSEPQTLPKFSCSFEKAKIRRKRGNVRPLKNIDQDNFSTDYPGRRRWSNILTGLCFF